MKSSEQENKTAEQWAQIKADMKAFLKTQSKNEIIRIVFSQLELYLEQREANKVLLERLKQYETTEIPVSDDVNLQP